MFSYSVAVTAGCLHYEQLRGDALSILGTLLAACVKNPVTVFNMSFCLCNFANSILLQRRTLNHVFAYASACAMS
jgi:hypothetical protein